MAGSSEVGLYPAPFEPHAPFPAIPHPPATGPTAPSRGEEAKGESLSLSPPSLSLPLSRMAISPVGRCDESPRIEKLKYAPSSARGRAGWISSGRDAVPRRALFPGTFGPFDLSRINVPRRSQEKEDRDTVDFKDSVGSN